MEALKKDLDYKFDAPYCEHPTSFILILEY